MTSIQWQARKAGFLYLLILIIAPFNNLYIPSAFVVPGNATATAQRIIADPFTFRLGILSGLIGQLLFLFLVLSLYELFKGVNRKQARLMVVLVVAGACVAIANLFNQLAPLILLSGASFLKVFDQPQLEALALAFLRLNNSGTDLAMAFWALWLFPLGLLVTRSGFIPRVIGWLLILGGLAYLALSFTSIAFPAYSHAASQVLLPFYAVGELAMILWLVVKGANVPASTTPSPSAS